MRAEHENVGHNIRPRTCDTSIWLLACRLYLSSTEQNKVGESGRRMEENR